MSILRVSAVVLASLVLAAHLLRAGGLVLALAALALPLLLAVGRRWADRVLALALVAGALEWARTLLALVDLRRAHGQPYLRLALILGAVVLVTAGAAALAGLRSRQAGSRGLVEAVS